MSDDTFEMEFEGNKMAFEVEREMQENDKFVAVSTHLEKNKRNFVFCFVKEKEKR